MKYYLIFNKETNKSEGAYINHMVGDSYRDYAKMYPKQKHIEVSEEDFNKKEIFDFDGDKLIINADKLEAKRIKDKKKEVRLKLEKKKKSLAIKELKKDLNGDQESIAILDAMEEEQDVRIR